jgi:hypothetical protein
MMMNDGRWVRGRLCWPSSTGNAEKSGAEDFGWRSGVGEVSGNWKGMPRETRLPAQVRAMAPLAAKIMTRLRLRYPGTAPLSIFFFLTPHGDP